MITQLLNTVKEIFTVNMAQSVKPLPISIYENEANTSNTSDMKTNQSKRK